MNPAIRNERLTAMIVRFGREAVESRQIAKRLQDLLPCRFYDIKREYAREARSGKAERLALVDRRYLQHIDEYTTVHADALKARIEYETHAMLFHARQSLRGFERAR